MALTNFNKLDTILVYCNLLCKVYSKANLRVNPRHVLEWGWVLCLSCLTQCRVLMFCLLISGSGEQFSKPNWNSVYCAAGAEWNTSVRFRKLCSAQKHSIGVKMKQWYQWWREKKSQGMQLHAVLVTASLLLGKCFCLCFVVSQFAITQPFSPLSELCHRCPVGFLVSR